ncbi:MAG: 30S ribosomal protein S15, partial [Candidatus Cryosericum sp.]
MLTAEEKSKIIGEFKLSEDDTGSFEVQVAMLSKRILALSDHLQSHR